MDGDGVEWEIAQKREDVDFIERLRQNIARLRRALERLAQ